MALADLGIIKRGHHLIIRSKFPENCMNIKKIEWKGRGGSHSKFYSVDQPLV